MKQSIAHIALVVADYDEAIKFYTEKLGFELIEDTPQSETSVGFWSRRKIPMAASYYWQKASATHKRVESAIRPAGASFFFCKRTIFGAITMNIWQKA